MDCRFQAYHVGYDNGYDEGYNRGYAEALALFLDWDARSPEYRAEIIEGVKEIEEAIASNVMLSQDRLTAIYELMTVD